VLGLVALAAARGGPSDVTQPAAAAAASRRIDLTPFFAGARQRVAPYLVVAVALGLLLLRDASIGAEAGIRWLLVGGLVLLVGSRPAFLAVSTALVLGLAVFVLQPAVVLRDRSFFGVSEVLRPAGAPVTVLMNGTTVHGVQSTDPVRALTAESYYAPSGPFGDVFRQLAVGDVPRDIAIVGLGAGALTAYERPNWTMTYYEIDPVVAKVASDPRYFTYLSSAPSPATIVLGDARLSLQVVPDHRYDAIVIDAFSSDAIPTHLLTREAFALYARVVKPGGLVVVHISNRYYDLAPAVAGAATANDLDASVRAYAPSEADGAAGAWPTILTISTTSAAEIQALRPLGWEPLLETVPPMTDDFMDVLRFLRPIW